MNFYKINSYLIICTLFVFYLNVQVLAFCFQEDTDTTIDASYVLLTGFGPFASYDANPSQLVVEALNGTILNNKTIVSLVLPINFSSAVDIVNSAIDQYNPVLVINLGLAPGHRWINVETVGINLKKDAEDPQDRLQRINPVGPFFYVATLPTKKICTVLREQNIPTRQSIFAGTYLCNTVMYQTLKYIKENDLSTPAGFIHLPLLSTQSNAGLKFDMMIQVVTLSIETSLEHSSF